MERHIDIEPARKARADVVVVGGSLSGLAAALALADRGVSTQILERSPGSVADGAGLGVDLALLGRVTGRADRIAALPVLHDRVRDSVAYGDIRSWMRTLAEGEPLVDLDEHTTVSAVHDGSDAATVKTADGERPAALVIGADGVRSTVRRAVDPSRPDADYAGYVLWRALVEESDVPAAATTLPADDTMSIYRRDHYRLVAYAVPGADGSVEPGRRRLSVAWYDRDSNSLLAELGVIGGGTIRGSLDPERIPPEVVARLRDDARLWPSPWAQAIDRALGRRRLFGFPIGEYLPDRLTRGRLAIVGDAAHAASPMTGAGFHNALVDAQALADLVARHGPTPAALVAYEKLRLGPSRSLVLGGRAWGQSYLREV
jgi:2-polyprenyl-6-methoxyphenol hydroxylase-like FAD-dependent oxidoreductase